MRQDSVKHTYQIWAQDQAQSCAVASIWMARSQARQQSFAETEWDLAWRFYQQTVIGMPATSSYSATQHVVVLFLSEIRDEFR
jgi:hypothetical protein